MQTTLSLEQSQRLARLALNDMATIKPGEEPDEEFDDNGGGGSTEPDNNGGGSTEPDNGGGTNPGEGGGDLGD